MILQMTITDDGKKMSGAVIEVYRNGKFVEKVGTTSRGVADVSLLAGGIYTISISGNGKIVKKLEINTKDTPADLTEPIMYPAIVDIFNKVDGIDYSILNQPIGKISFSGELFDFVVDEAHTNKVQSSLKKLTEDFEEKKAQEELANKDKQKSYDAAIKIADKAFAAEQWEVAEAEYKKASAILPIETYPSFQLAELKSKLIEIRKLDAKYDQAIAAAEAAEKSKDYPTAIAEFKRASGYKPSETYPSGKAKELQSTLANAAKVEQNYLAAIEKGDNSLKANDLNTAKISFEEASKLKPEESYPKNKLAEITDVLSKQKLKEEEYNSAITAADAAFASKDYVLAKAEYKKASVSKPTESYPKDQITKVDGLLAESAKQEQDYLAAIELGDNSLTSKKYDEAIAAFLKASKIKATEEYPKNKIKEIEAFMAKNAEKDKLYNESISTGDKALASKDYEIAKTKYSAASDIKPTESYPKEKISEIEGLIAANAAQEKKYTDAITAGDNALGSKDYETAKSAYSNAISIKPNEKYPSDKLAEIQSIVVGMQEQEEKYKTAIAEADGALASQKLEEAKKAYLVASGLKPTEAYPQDKLKEIDGIIASKAAKDADFTAAISEGDAAFKSEDFDAAANAYTKALSIKPAETYPQTQLGLIDSKKEAIAAEKAAGEKLEADYLAAIKAGDAALASKDYAGAKTSYENAQSLKSSEQYPKDKLKEIQDQQGALAAKEANYLKAIESGDKLFGSKDYSGAKTAFENALAIKPEESYPKTQITEIDTKLKEISDAEAASAKLDSDYQAAISEGDSKMAAEEFDNAIASFNKALELKPNEKYPQDKISEINGLVEKQAADATAAKLEADYQAAITEGDSKMAAEEFDNAIASFNKALGFKPSEKYPQDKISEINGLVEKQAADATAAKLEADYQAAITEGDSKMASEEFDIAIASYNKALGFKPSEKYPQDKISEINSIVEKQATDAAEKEKLEAIQKQYDGLIASADKSFGSADLNKAREDYQAALALKSDEDYPQTKIDEINTTLADAADQDKAYQDAIALADKALGSEDFENAKLKYAEASSIKSTEQYPKDKLVEIESKLAALAAEQEEIRLKNEQSAELDANYEAAIKEGDDAFESDDFEKAEKAYTTALSIKPAETHPQTQLAAIDEKRLALASAADQAAAEAEKAKIEAEKAKVEAEYQALIIEADQMFENEDYDNAIAKYSKALEIKDEPYPKEQLKVIDGKLDSMAKEADQAKIDEEYQSIVSIADELFSANDFEKARVKYNEALSVKGSETYPVDQITAIESKIEELASMADKEAQEAEKAAQEAEKAELEANYNAAIVEGDNGFNSEDFESAEKGYLKALSFKPSETYPQTQLGLIDSKREAAANLANKMKEDEAKAKAAAALEKEYSDAVSTADNAFNAEDYDNAEKAYMKALSFKPSETYPQSQLSLIDSKREAIALAQENAENLSREELNKNYQEVIAAADLAFSSRAWVEAIEKYKEAGRFKPDESYPPNQIEEINRILAEKEAKQEAKRLAREAATANAAAYQTAISEGDRAFDSDDYNEAENKYRLALSLKPDGVYPADKLAEIKEIIDAKARELAENNRKKNEAKSKADDYKRLISEGDEAFNKKSYSQAKSSYASALILKSNETYPRQQIEIINKELETQRLAREERLKKLDEPIQIQTGARAEINSDAEAEIDKLYREKWNKRNSDKNTIIEVNKDKFNEIQKANKEKEVEKRKNALELLDEITVSIKESNEGTDDIYLQNYDQILDKEKALATTNQEWNRESERNRQNVYEDEKSLADKLRGIEKKRSEKIVEGKLEAVVERRKEVLRYIDNHSDDQYDRIGDNQLRINDKLIEVRQFRDERSDNFKENQEVIEKKMVSMDEEHQRLENQGEKARAENKDLTFYQGENKPRQDRMAEDYPQGFTEEIIENQNNSTTIRRVAVEGTQVDIFEKTLYSWGGIFYSKNGKSTTKVDWDSNSK